MKKNIRSKKVTIVEYIISVVSIIILGIAIKSNYSTYQTVFGNNAQGEVKAQIEATEEREKISVTEIQVSSTEAELTVGDIKNIDGNVLPENADNKLVKWTSSDETIATVSPIGKITAIKEGTCTITAFADENESITKIINVTVKPVEVKKEETPVVNEEAKQGNTKQQTKTNNQRKQSNNSNQAAQTQTQTQTQTQSQPTQTYTAPSTYAGSNGYDSYCSQVVALINQERANYGIAPLNEYQGINQLAKVRAEEAAQVWSHTRPDGRRCFTVFSDYGLSFSAKGENLAFGQRTPEAVVNAWMNSSTHRANILEPRFKNVTMWVYNSNGTLYWSQLFTG